MPKVTKKRVNAVAAKFMEDLNDAGRTISEREKIRICDLEQDKPYLISNLRKLPDAKYKNTACADVEDGIIFLPSRVVEKLTEEHINYINNNPTGIIYRGQIDIGTENKAAITEFVPL